MQLQQELRPSLGQERPSPARRWGRVGVRAEPCPAVPPLGSPAREPRGRDASMGRLSRAWQRRCSPSAYKGQSSHTDRLFSPLQQLQEQPSHPGTRRRRRAAREKHWHAAGKKRNREIKMKFKCHAGSSEPPAQSWCQQIRDGWKQEGCSKMPRAGVKTNSCRFSELGARPGVLPGEKAAAATAASSPRSDPALQG